MSDTERIEQIRKLLSNYGINNVRDHIDKDEFMELSLNELFELICEIGEIMYKIQEIIL